MGGRYDVRPGPEREPGTTVTLVPRRGAEHLLSGSTVRELAELYGSLLPVRFEVDMLGRRLPVAWVVPVDGAQGHWDARGTGRNLVERGFE